MAPFMGPSREQLIKALSKWFPDFPITLGRYSPEAIVERVDGTWRIVMLEEDLEASARAGREALASGRNWMPEHTWQFLKPARVLLEANSRDAFIEAVQKMKWPFGDGLR